MLGKHSTPEAHPQTLLKSLSEGRYIFLPINDKERREKLHSDLNPLPKQNKVQT
jgi:hypothetical protein